MHKLVLIGFKWQWPSQHTYRAVGNDPSNACRLKRGIVAALVQARQLAVVWPCLPVRPWRNVYGDTLASL